MKAPNPRRSRRYEYVFAPPSDLSPLNLFGELWQLFGPIGGPNIHGLIETFCRKSLMELSRFVKLG